MFRGLSNLTLDAKGRLAIPTRHRDRLSEPGRGVVVVTLNPLDRCLWIYPLPEWELVESKLMELSDFDRQSRRTKQIMRGHATECELDAQGRILLPPGLREFAALTRDVVLLGQGNKFELWDLEHWNRQCDEWLQSLGTDASPPAEALRNLAL